jgi:uncharacterized membrane protein
MFTRLVTIWEAVRTSLWALPLAMAVAASALAVSALNIDLAKGSASVWFLFSGSASQAPDFLSSLVTAMITMATLAISITMVVLTLAAQQLGPRLIRSFMGDRRTQTALGLFVATVIYLLLVLRSAYGHGNSVSNFAVTGGTVLVLICIATLVLFVHHLAHSIISDNVIDRVGAQLDRDLMRLLPEKTPEHREAPADIKKDGAPVRLSTGGYVQAVDFGSIVAAAAEADAKVELVIRAGHHAVPGRVIAYVAPARAADDGLCRTIRNAVVVGGERTAVQDLEFSIRHLVEIALRALSPGINDPYTANAVLDRLTLSIAKIMTRGTAKSVWQDDKGTARLVTPVSTFEGITDAAFNQIRQQALPAVIIHMADCIGQLLQQAEGGYRPPLEKHLRLAVNAGRRSLAAQEDLRALEARARSATGEGRNGDAHV